VGEVFWCKHGVTHKALGDAYNTPPGVFGF